MPKTPNNILVNYSCHATSQDVERALDTFGSTGRLLGINTQDAQVALSLEETNYSGSDAEVRSLLPPAGERRGLISLTIVSTGASPPIPPIPNRQHQLNFNLGPSSIALRVQKVPLSEELQRRVREIFEAAFPRSDAPAAPQLMAETEALRDSLGEARAIRESLTAFQEAAKTTNTALEQELRRAQVDLAGIKPLLEEAEKTRRNLQEARADVSEIHANVTRLRTEMAGQAGQSSVAAQEVARARDATVAFSETLPSLKARVEASVVEGGARYEKQIAQLVEKHRAFDEQSVAKCTQHVAELESAAKEDNSKKNAILELLGGATAGRLHGAFEDRKTHLERTQRYSSAAIFFVTCVLAGWTWYVVQAIVAAGISQAGLIRIVAAIPFLGLEWLLVSHHNRRALLVEKYAFKAAVALSLRYYQDLIGGASGGDSGREFTLEAARNIYKDPTVRSSVPSREARRLIQMCERIGTKVIENGASVARTAVETGKK
jgi:hypothetical protein